MEIKRSFYKVLADWKSDKRGQCLLVNGARQVGKTFLIEKFGRENYESFIEPKKSSWSLIRAAQPCGSGSE